MKRTSFQISDFYLVTTSNFYFVTKYKFSTVYHYFDTHPLLSAEINNVKIYKGKFTKISIRHVW